MRPLLALLIALGACADAELPSEAFLPDDDDVAVGDDDDAGPDDDDSGPDDDDSAPDDDDDTAVEELALIGTWLDEWTTFHVITGEQWRSGTAPNDSVYVISQYDNDAGWLVAENGERNAFNPGAWSRFDWTWVDDQLYYCTTAFDAATEQAALDTAAAEATDPTASGCGGFAWTSMNADQGPLGINGVYTDPWGTFHVVLQDVWHQGGLGSNRYTVTQYDNAEGWAVAQNHADNEYNATLWSKFDFVFQGDAWWYCQSAFDAPDEETALATVASNATDPATAGCGGFAWTNLGTDEGFSSLRGSFTDEWTVQHTITWDTWTQGTDEYLLSMWSREDNWSVARNGAGNAFNPGLYSKFHWTSLDDALYYCQTAFDAASAAEALATVAPDASNPSADGCGGFAWTNLTP